MSSVKTINVSTVIGARPQFVKAAVLSKAISDFNASSEGVKVMESIVHTGQHYDANMSEIFFSELGIPRPERNLEVGSGKHGAQTGVMLERLEKVYEQQRPDLVLNYGDTNSTLASALVAAKMDIPVAHVESGLRSFNRRMPEEINRIVTDRLATWLFCPTDTAVANLASEGMTDNAFNVGDVMYDAARIFGQISDCRSTALADLGITSKGYLLATVHRAENTDERGALGEIFAALLELSARSPVIVPLHPRTKKKIEDYGLWNASKPSPSLRLIDPVSFLDMVALEKGAALILTDSGGVQKEAFFHGVPCVTLRNETEWVELVEHGWNVLVGSDRAKIVRSSAQMLETFRGSPPRVFEDLYGDGQAANKIVQHLFA